MNNNAMQFFLYYSFVYCMHACAFHDDFMQILTYALIGEQKHRRLYSNNFLTKLITLSASKVKNAQKCIHLCIMHLNNCIIYDEIHFKF